MVDTQDRIAAFVEESRGSEKPGQAPADAISLAIIDQLAARADNQNGGVEETPTGEQTSEDFAPIELEAELDVAAEKAGDEAQTDSDPLREMLERAYRDSVLDEDDEDPKRRLML